MKEVLKDEIRFQKTVLRRKGTLKLAGTVTELTRALELHLPEEENAQPHVPGPAPDAEQAADVAEPEADPAAPEVESAEPEADTGHYDTFKFTRQGELVTVFYESSFSIGQVTEVQSEGTATVQYLTKATGHPSYFCWPSVDDVCSSSWPINLQKNCLKVNSTYLIFITEINAKSTLVFICDLAKYAVSSI